jgi:hypothetical protein
MSELSQRGANFFKFFSMFTVFGSLLYMYAYSRENSDLVTSTQDGVVGIPRTYIFYYGLAVFAIINLVLSYWINIYKSVKEIDEKSIRFKSKEQKESLLLWFTYFLTGTNVLITCFILYLALIKINDAASNSGYMYIAIVAVVLWFGILIRLVSSIFKKWV